MPNDERPVDALRQLFPDGHFAEPATEKEIEAAESALGVRFPKQLRDLYLICDGFREYLGNSKYLLSLFKEDRIGSLVGMTKFMWSDETIRTNIDLRAFIIFGSSSADESWGINSAAPTRIIAYHHHMIDEFEERGTRILEVYRADYAAYEDV